MKKLLTILMLLSGLSSYAQMDKSERYERGWIKLQEIDGEAGEKVIDGLKDISPELSNFILEYVFGDVYSLNKLDNKSKEIAAVASLVAQSAMPQLKVHLNGALNTGCSINEVKEIILQMSVYTGFPKCINAMNALKEVVAERKEKGHIDEEGKQAKINENADRYETGKKNLAILNEQQEQLLRETYKDFSPELVNFIIEYGFGDIFSRENLDKKYRQIATIAALVTLGNAQPQLKFHIDAALNIGLKVDEINEIMLLMTVYAGFPAAINGTNTLNEVVKGRSVDR